ncbi:MAG: alpha/beta hydrolase-fold protein [Gemmatimonadota bacterium]|jgi:S-formylglutathione hydrolase FrmB
MPHEAASAYRRSGVPPLLLAVLLTTAQVPGLAAQDQPAPPKLPDDARVHLVEIPGSVPESRPAAVILPRGYDRGSRRYPVLYLLHGLTGSYVDWLTRTNVLTYTANLPVIVVLPDAGDSWYVNSATDSTARYADYIAKDVVRYADTHYRTLPYPQARYVAGLSMGGYGALRLATEHPRTFSFAASLSGAFTPIRDWDHPSLVQAFGPVGSAARAAGDLAAILENAEPDGLPYYYLGCGTGDGLITGNREIAAILSTRGLPYEYHETHGVHEWEYWDREIRPILQRIVERIPPEARAPARPGRGPGA